MILQGEASGSLLLVMCVIAGYIGEQRAAPILLEMLKREEGLAGGYYSGVVTLHQGKLYHAKVVGDAATLIRETDALELPGTIGLAHGRTQSGGGQLWAHPFIDTHAELAYIANGARGLYQDKVDFQAEGERLLQMGYTFSSAEEGEVSNYPHLPDGRCVHFSDIVCQAIAAQYRQVRSGPLRLVEAASQTYQRLPGSVVGLCLHRDHPDELAGMRFNMPMQIGRLRDNSLVVATAAKAFPDGVDWQMSPPAMSALRIHRNEGVTVFPFADRSLIGVGERPSAQLLSDRVVEFLRENKQRSIHEILQAVAPLWSDDTLKEREMRVFPLLDALQREGKVELYDVRVAGVNPEQTVPSTRVRWVAAI